MITQSQKGGAGKRIGVHRKPYVHWSKSHKFRCRIVRFIAKEESGKRKGPMVQQRGLEGISAILFDRLKSRLRHVRQVEVTRSGADRGKGRW